MEGTAAAGIQVYHEQLSDLDHWHHGGGRLLDVPTE